MSEPEYYAVEPKWAANRREEMKAIMQDNVHPAVTKALDDTGILYTRRLVNVEPFSRLRAYMEHVTELARSLGIDAARQFMAINPYRSRGKQRSKPFCRTILARYVPGKVYPRQSKRECERRIRQGVAA